MKQIFTLLLLANISMASINTINSFEADFIQNITDDKEKVLTYNGHIIASKPQNALWRYTDPIKKEIYIDRFEITIVEPEIEQVIIKSVESNFDFFKMIQNAKKIKKDTYETLYKDTKFTITTKNGLIRSISYIDEFENDVKIEFLKQKQNEEVDSKVFTPKFPLEYDIIRD